MTELERPQPRTRPRPAADESVDPVEAAGGGVRLTLPPASDVANLLPAASRGEQNTAPGPPTADFVDRGPEATVQLNVRVNSGTNAAISRLQSKTGWTKRRIVEQATELLAQQLDS